MVDGDTEEGMAVVLPPVAGVLVAGNKHKRLVSHYIYKPGFWSRSQNIPCSNPDIQISIKIMLGNGFLGLLLKLKTMNYLFIEHIISFLISGAGAVLKL